MDTDQEDLELLDRYIHGKMTPAEVQKFEFRLEDDRELARKYRLRKTFPSMRNEEPSFSGESNTPATNSYASVKDSFRKLKPGSLVWLALIVILAGGLVYFLLSGRNQPEKKAAEATKPSSESTIAPIRDTTRERPDSVTNAQSGQAVFELDTNNLIKLMQPANGISLTRTGDIMFTWRQLTDSLTNFYIFSEGNDKMIIWRGIRPGIREYKIKAITFKPGKYYWYVGTRKVRRTFIITE